MDNNFNNNEYQANVVPQQAAQQAQPVSKKNAITAMALGIASACLCEGGIVGLVLAIISKSIRKKFLNENNGMDNGFSKAANITSTIGLIFSIIAIVSWTIWFIVIVVALIAGGASAVANPDFMDILEEFFDL